MLKKLRDKEDKKKTQIEFLEMKTLISEEKNTLDEINYSLDIAGKKK